MSEIFSKTAKGQEEIKTRASGLTQRMRQVLIFVDGKRSRQDLHGMLKGDDMNDLLAALVEEGYIEVSGKADDIPRAAAPAPAAAAAVPAAPAAIPQEAAPGTPAKKPEAPKISPEEMEKRRLEAEKNSEIAMARSFLGKMS
ncbi:MAG: hypothetical protein HYS18_03095 [Burkholderiales bacterium]|nr:hypothetical protein [Burkholderiales bacterium]